MVTILPCISTTMAGETEQEGRKGNGPQNYPLSWFLTLVLIYLCVWPILHLSLPPNRKAPKPPLYGIKRLNTLKLNEFCDYMIQSYHSVSTNHSLGDVVYCEGNMIELKTLKHIKFYYTCKLCTVHSCFYHVRTPHQSTTVSKWVFYFVCGQIFVPLIWWIE